MRRWKLHRWTGATVEELAEKVNPQVRGWLNYYGKFYKSEMNFLWEILNRRLMRWFRSQYKRCKGRKGRAYQALEKVQAEKPLLFAHWKFALTTKGGIGGAV